MPCVDTLLVGDKPPDLIKSISLGYPVKKTQAIETRFELSLRI